MEGVPNKNVRGNPKANNKQPPPKLTNFFKKTTTSAAVPVVEPKV